LRVVLLASLITGALFFSSILWSFLQKPTTSVDRLLSEQELPFLSKIGNDEAWVYFGYVGCSTACPTAIELLHSASHAFYFVNLIPGLDDNAVQEYVNAFGKTNIIGIQASDQDLKNIEAFFANIQSGRIGVYDPELHSDQLFHLRREGKNWKFIEILRGSYQVKTLDIHN
jgi:hypothetical protein